ncbi:MAG: cytochrome c3 family protein [Candidatus Marinimicrobia bacterium]|nr:cytochrome c3 family protein [Candidatus Neomarinimicrobiota bacterium]
MKKLLLSSLVLLIAIGVTNAQIANTKHDLSTSSTSGGAVATTETGTCIFCHTPHTTNGADLLWNKGSGTIATYNTVALASTAGSSGEGSTACMSCHDGATAIGVILNESGSGASGATIAITDGGNVTSGIIAAGMPDMTRDLSGDHPVGILYSESIAADASGFVAAATVTSTGGLKLTNGKVECNSCHDPHDNTNGTFLRKSNASSALCITCHSK